VELRAAAGRECEGVAVGGEAGRRNDGEGGTAFRHGGAHATLEQPLAAVLEGLPFGGEIRDAVIDGHDAIHLSADLIGTGEIDALPGSAGEAAAAHLSQDLPFAACFADLVAGDVRGVANAAFRRGLGTAAN